MQFLPATGAFESLICIHPIFMEHLIFAASVGWASARMIAALKSPIPVAIRIDICVLPDSANGFAVQSLPPGQYRIAVTTATAVYAALTSVPT
jgi:hypothetical protein